MAEDDPITAPGEREFGHLYLLAQPETAAEEALVEFLASDDAAGVLQELLKAVLRERGSSPSGYQPDVDMLFDRVPSAEGLALTSYSARRAPAGSGRSWS